MNQRDTQQMEREIETDELADAILHLIRMVVANGGRAPDISNLGATSESYARMKRAIFAVTARP